MTALGTPFAYFFDIVEAHSAPWETRLMFDCCRLASTGQ